MKKSSSKNCFSIIFTLILSHFFGFFSAPRAFFPPIWWFFDWIWSFDRARMAERERNRRAGKKFFFPRERFSVLFKFQFQSRILKGVRTSTGFLNLRMASSFALPTPPRSLSTQICSWKLPIWYIALRNLEIYREIFRQKTMLPQPGIDPRSSR